MSKQQKKFKRILKKRLMNRRRFLTGDEADSFIKGHVDLTHMERTSDQGVVTHEVTIDGSLKLTDCTRSIYWGFDIGNYSDTTVASTLKKLKTTRALLDEFEAAMLKAIEYYNTHNTKKAKSNDD